MFDPENLPENQMEPEDSQALTVRADELAVAREQMALDLPKSNWDGYYDIKRKLNKTEALFEALPYWKNFSPVMALVSSVALVLFLALLSWQKFSELPAQIPLIFNQRLGSWELIDKQLLIVVPVIFAMLLVIILRLNRLVFNFDRRLSYIANLATILFNVLAAIAFSQLFALVLIY